MSEVHDVGLEMLSDADAVSLSFGEGQREGAEEARRSRDDTGDKP